MSTESHSQIEAAASDWLARCDSGGWTAADQLRFDEWLNESPLHRVAFLRLEHVWEQTRRLKALGAGCHSEGVPLPSQWMDARRRVALWSAAAAFVAAVVLYVAYDEFLAQDRYTTPIGGVASVPMSDGSIVTLNTDSEIHVVLNKTERIVSLDHGEAFFEVAKDPTRPFVVTANNERIVAIGTKFSVRRGDRDVRVVVTEGEVQVGSVTQSARRAMTSLIPGTIARASDAGTLLQTKPLREAEEILSWRTGMLIFRDTTLAEATAEFNRYNTRRVAIEDPQVAELRVTGTFRATNLDGFVRLLELGYPLQAEDRGNEIVLKGH